MFSKELEEVIEAALADGVLTDKERAVLHKRAAAEGVDPDELDVVIDGRLAKAKKQEDWLKPAPPSTLMNNKIGNVQKCPNCGAPYEPGTVKCPDCGHVFQNREVVLSSQRMTNGINQIMEKYAPKIEEAAKEEGRLRSKSSKDANINVTSRVKDAMKNEIKSFITNFPIPSAKDDLLEFITSMAARRSGIHNDYEDAYRAKLNESINKAKLYFPDDPQFAPLIERFTKLSFENLPSGGKMGVILAGLMVAALIIGLIGQCAGLS